MRNEIQDSIQRSVSHDEIVHVSITLAEDEDIYTVLEGVLVDDMVQLEHGEWDIWGSDEDAGGEWRLHIHLS